jgi:citrate lyase subunit beta/citryl-CoA lyase
MRETGVLRSLLFVPGDRPDRIAKVGRSCPDGVVIDLEDAVPADGKHAARQATLEALSTMVVPNGTLTLVRVNSESSPWHADDVAAVALSPAAGVALPKAENIDQIVRLRSRLDSAGRHDAVIVVGIETARGVAAVRSLLVEGSGAGIVAAYFGAEDYIADVGGRRTPEGLEVLYPRSEIVLAGRLAGMPIIDQAVLSVRDSAAFLADAERGRSIGYDGKLCIHPDQVVLAHRVFTPSLAEQTHARAVVQAMSAADGAGAVVVDGELVDEVHLRMARSTLSKTSGS